MSNSEYAVLDYLEYESLNGILHTFHATINMKIYQSYYWFAKMHYRKCMLICKTNMDSNMMSNTFKQNKRDIRM